MKHVFWAILSLTMLATGCYEPEQEILCIYGEVVGDHSEEDQIITEIQLESSSSVLVEVQQGNRQHEVWLGDRDSTLVDDMYIDSVPAHCGVDRVLTFHIQNREEFASRVVIQNTTEEIYLHFHSLDDDGTIDAVDHREIMVEPMGEVTIKATLTYSILTITEY